LLVELKALNVLSATDLIRSNITATLPSAVKQIIKVIIKLAQTFAYSRGITLINLKIFLQNICKNRTFMDNILKTNKNFNIIFIQEPPWTFIYTIPSFSNKNSNSIVGMPNHPNWITFFRSSNNDNKHPYVISYINTYFSYIYFTLRRDIFNYRDICCFSFFNNGNTFFMINVYSNDHELALKYLKNTEVNI